MPRAAREIPWLEKRENGIYYVCWYDKASRRTRRTTLGTKEDGEAKARYAAILVEGNDALAGQSRGYAGLTVFQALADYEREHVNQHVVAKQRQLIALAHLRRFFGDLPVAELGIPEARAYRAARKHTADPTVRRELGVLVAALNHAIRWKRLKGFDTSCVELPRVQDEEARWLTQDELRRLREAAGEDTRVRRFIENAYWSAGRREAVIALTVFQVNWEGGYVNLGKPGERQTKKRKAVVPIDPQWAPWLRRQYDEAKLRMSEDLADPGYLLGHGGAIRSIFYTTVRRAGLQDVTPHTMRHTRATHLLHAGVDIWTVAKLLGDSVHMVEKVYAHACQAVLRTKIERREG